MSLIYNGTNIKKINFGGTAVKKVIYNGTQVWTAGNTVTYVVDTGITYHEEVDYGASCLSPKTFTPVKSGWAFLGWRIDATASATVFTSKIMGDTPITLYAVFKTGVTVGYYNGTASIKTQTKMRYYNNGNVANPSFTMSQAALSGWTARGWSTGNTAAASILYSNGATFSRDSNVTLYGMYYKTITLSYNGNGSTSGSTAAHSDARYYNSNGANANPTFTLKANGYAKAGYTFSKWALNGASGTQYAAGGQIILAASATMYAVWTSNAFYAIASGGVVNKTYCPNAYETWGGHSGGAGSSHTGSDGYSSTKYYGGYGHTANGGGQGYGVLDKNIDFGCDTGWINTKECKYVKIMPYVYNQTGKKTPIPYLHIYGNGSGTAFANYGDYPYNNGPGKIYTQNNPNTDQFTVTPPTSPLVVDISAYSTIRITYHADNTDDRDAWVNCGLQYVYFYN